MAELSGSVLEWIVRANEDSCLQSNGLGLGSGPQRLEDSAVPMPTLLAVEEAAVVVAAVVVVVVAFVVVVVVVEAVAVVVVVALALVAVAVMQDDMKADVE